MRGRDIYLSTTYHTLVYDITYKNLFHTHPGIGTAAYKGEDIPSKKHVES